ncbi:MAG: hypothetical protein ACT4OO_06740 [Nitrospiraceae bacterium]
MGQSICMPPTCAAILSWTKPLILVGICSALFTPDIAHCATSSASVAGPSLSVEAPNFVEVVHSQSEQLGAVRADADAQKVFSSRIGPLLGLSDAVLALANKPQASKQFGEPLVVTLAQITTRLVQNMAMWRLALMAQTAASSSRDDQMGFINAVAQQQTWISHRPGFVSLRQAANIAQVLHTYGRPQPVEERTGYSEYAADLDRIFPSFTDSDTSWLTVAQTAGPIAINERLSAPANPTSDNKEHEATLAAMYVEQRLRPVFLVQLANLAGRAEVEVSRQVYIDWVSLRSLKETLVEWRGLARLCGTWQWTIHNHQNHGEQKTVIVFPPPGSRGTTGTSPAEIIALGDMVYLRWEAEGRVQEDSLLFTKEGQRLEGTFVNSFGGWGSIAGKRTGGCPR